MIQTNELRVGNYYNRKHGKGWTRTMITEEIMGKIFSDSNEYALDDFENIELSSEILKEFGFEKIIDNEYLHSSLSNYIIAKHKVDEQEDETADGWWLWLTINNVEIPQINISCLHQLQLIFFSLTGDNLK